MARAGHGSRGIGAAVMWVAVLLLTVLGLLLPPTATASGDTWAVGQEPVLAGTDGEDSLDPRITGGVEVDPPGKYPFMAALVTRGGDAFWDQFCGGSVIAADWVLTAAHCVVGESAGTIDVVVGRHDLTSDAGERIRASLILIHPSYDDVSLENDLALIRLATPTSVEPVRLPSDGSLEGAGTAVTVLGWGDTLSTPQWPDGLREVTLPLVSDTDCQAAYAGFDYPEYVLPSALMLCAGDLAAGGIDSCSGDSGGPLFATTTDGFTQLGIVSWGNECGLPGYPGVYTRVSAYATWITGQLATSAGPRCFGMVATIVGTPAGERIEGTPGADVIVGRGGNDVIDGLEGDDRICGGPGDDSIDAGKGHDRVQGGAGGDFIRGGLGADALRGGAGADDIAGGVSNDTLYGERGADLLDGEGGTDKVVGGLGIDTCYGEAAWTCELPESTGAVCDPAAVPLVLGTATEGAIEATELPYPANAVYYCVEVPRATDEVTVDLTGMTTDLDLYVGIGSIEDAQYHSDWGSADWGTADEHIAITQPPAGLYYLEVLSFLGEQSGFTILMTAD